MKRYAALLLVSFFILSTSCIYIDGDGTHVFSSDLEESVTTDTSFPADSSSEKKSTTWMLVTFPLILVIITIVEMAESIFNERRSFLTTVFYQSNFVITTPLLK